MDNKLKAQTKKLSPEELKEIESFKKWLIDNKYNPKDLKEVAELYKKYKSQKTRAAAHGAKLNYFRILKNQCPEGEELYYYKRGGSVRCGCNKKMEDGGKTPKKKSVIDNFKNRKQDQATKDSIAANKYNDQEVQTQKPGSYKKNKKGLVQWTPDRTQSPYKKEKGGTIKTTPREEPFEPKVKKGKPSDNISRKGNKTKTMSMCGGSVIKKFKMHRLGGSLNDIPFMQKGTYKGGVLYRFRRSTNDMNNGYKTYSDLIMMTQDPLGRPTYDTPPIPAGRTIYVTPLGNDTIFYTNNDIFNGTPKGDLNLKKQNRNFIN